MNPPGQDALPWFRRIGLRLAVGLTILLLLAYFLFPRVHDMGLRLFGLPGIHEAGVPAMLQPRADLVVLARELLEDAQQAAPGRWVPQADRLKRLDRELAAVATGFAWVDADHQLVCSSPGLGVAELPSPLGEDGSMLTQAGEGLGVGRIGTTIYKEGELAGYLLVYTTAKGRAVIGAVGGGVTPQQALHPRLPDRVINVASALFIGSLAMLLSWAVSRMVTGRLRRLSLAASAPVGEAGDLPGPFDESGDDEIASLARTMNGMRERVFGLLGDLKARDHDRREWIAQVSHDLRTPLTALVASLDRAELVAAEAKHAELGERLGVARLDAARLGALIEDLLDIARLEADDALVIEPVPPGELVRQTSRELTALAEREGICMRPEVEPGLPTLQADGRRLMRGLENLARNAIQHGRSTVNVNAVMDGHNVRFEVLDDGPGLPTTDGQVQLQSLSNRRSRADSAGLGLEVVRKVAEAHGGCFGGANRAGGGAHMWFVIPAVRQDAD